MQTQTAIGATSLLSIIAFHLLISDQLPDVGYLTKADLLLMGSYFFIFLTLAESIRTNRVFVRAKIDKSERIDKLCRWVFPPSYAVFITLTMTV